METSACLYSTAGCLLAPQLAISFQFAQFRDFSENLISQKMSEFIVDTTSEELGDLCYVFQLANGAHLEQKWGYFMGTSDKHQDLNSN
ncbi:hypothetical protein T4B_13440 [Trichinella pseudospiralis]|uniref:Uncharacterized protein n=1 Tax=Trichinella pseudospiralis TaxID=6337 RepID=A0A0V1GR93_TRIPS|nr:hypothetical protein T4B_13440 [Trichinella pseudospiralis]